EDPVLIQLCTGIPYGAPDDLFTLLAMVNRLPPGAIFSTFSIGRMQIPFVAMAALAGGNVRVGLEDNLYLSRGTLASNGELVAPADLGAAATRGDADVRRHARGGGRRRRLHPGERTRTHPPEARAARRREPRRAGRCRDRVVDLRPPPLRAPGGNGASGTAHG